MFDLPRAAKTGGLPRRKKAYAKAKEFAEDWYLGLRGKYKRARSRKASRSRKPPRSSSANTRSSPKARGTHEYVQDQRTGSRSIWSLLRQHGPSRDNARPDTGYRIHRHEEATKEHGKPPARRPCIRKSLTLRQTSKRRPPPWLRLSSRSLGALPGAPGKSRIARGFRRRNTRSSITPPAARAEEPPLQVGIGAVARLRSLHGEYRIAPGRGAPVTVPRCRDRRG